MKPPVALFLLALPSLSAGYFYFPRPSRPWGTLGSSAIGSSTTSAASIAPLPSTTTSTTSPPSAKTASISTTAPPLLEPELRPRSFDDTHGRDSNSNSNNNDDSNPGPRTPERMLLSQVKALTVRAGELTTHRRLPEGVAQLRCASRAAVCSKANIEVMRCVNAGPRYGPEDVQWTCTAAGGLPPGGLLRLGSTDVSCEGWDGPDDPWVLRGSCGVTYTLVVTDAGRRRWPELDWGDGDDDPEGGAHGAGSKLGGVLFMIMFVGVAAWILYSACIRAPQRAARGQWHGRGDGGDDGDGGGGGWRPDGGDGYDRFDDGWDRHDDPPPPYPGPSSKLTQQHAESSQATRQGQQQQRGPQAGRGWRSGVLGALAGGGAAATYWAASNRQQQQQQQQRFGSGWRSSREPSWSGSYDEGSSTSTYESTGFGSTSRR